MKSTQAKIEEYADKKKGALMEGSAPLSNAGATRKGVKRGTRPRAHILTQ